MMTSKIAAMFCMVVSHCSAYDWAGKVVHEAPDFYESDGVTLKSDCGKKPLRLLTPRPQYGGISDAMGQLMPAFKLAIKEINRLDTILPDYVVELHLIESGCSNQVGLQSTLKALIEKPAGYYKMVFGPTCSGPTMLINDALQPFSLFEVNPLSRASALSVDSRYPNLCRISPPLSFLTVGMKRLIELFGWTRLRSIDDGTGLAKGTATLVIMSMQASKDDYVQAGGDVSKCTAFDCYDFDTDYVSAHRLTLGTLTSAAELVDEKYVFKVVKEGLYSGATRVVAFNGYESAGLRFFCALYKSGLYEELVTISPTGWWGSSWVRDQMAEQTVETNGEYAGCTLDQLNTAAQHYIAFDQLSFYASDTLRHGVTNAVLNDVKNAYGAQCDVESGGEGCHWSFAPYEYDGLAGVANMFHKWIYEQGNDLSYLNLNATATRELYNTMLTDSFLGVTGQVEYYNTETLNCERKGAFGLKQWRDGNWLDIASYMHETGFGTLPGAEWIPIHWHGGETYFGTQTGWYTVKAGAPATVGSDASGLDKIPADRLTLVTCPAGQIPDETLQNCVKCAAGKFGEGTSCVECAKGKFTETEGMDRCEECKPGYYANHTGLTSCEACPAGQHTDGSRGYHVCVDCAKGKASNTGEGECTYCPQGTYADQEGTGPDCKSCAPLTTKNIASFSETACVCDEGTYMHNGQCKSCPEGMECPIGSDFANFAIAKSSDGKMGNAEFPYPVVLPRYWSSTSDPTSVFVCESESSCPGGAPETCGGGLEEQACVRCEQDFIYNGKECSPCTSVETSKVLFPVLPILLGPVLVSIVYKIFGDPIEKWESWQNTCTCIVFVMLNHYQMLDLIRGATIILPSTLQDLFQGWAFTNDVTSLLKVQCAGVRDFGTGFIVKTLTPIFVLVIFLFTKAVSKAASVVSQKPVLDMEPNRLFNAFGSVMFTFFSAIAALSLLLFKCTSNPNGEKTLNADLSVICYKDEWNSMIAIAAIAVLLYCFGFGGLFTKVIIEAPSSKQFADKNYHMRWKFLFIKFRPTVWWWALLFLAKNVFMNLGFVLFTHGVGQLFWSMTVTIAYTIIVVIFMPYRSMIANYVELVASLSIVYITALMVWFSEREDEYNDPIMITTAFISFIPLAFGLGVLGKVALQGLGIVAKGDAQVNANHEKFVKSVGQYLSLSAAKPELALEFFQTVGEWDRYFMGCTAELIEFELMGKASKLGSSMRLVDLSSKRSTMLRDLKVDGGDGQQDGGKTMVV